MSGHEARINDALKSLGEEFRLGMVAADEYRSRRRLLLESWGERDATTSPRSLKGNATATTPVVPMSRPNVIPHPPKRNLAAITVGIVALVVIGAGARFVLSHRAAPEAARSSIAPPVAPLSAEVAAIKQAADEFLARNSWDAEPIEGFLAKWQPLSAEDRERAQQEPSLRTLRYELQQNLQAETQLVPADAPPEQRRRLDALTRFARELGG